ncbi:F-box protein At1g47340-like [Salvia hispanica]|uniref:F-box protein At1g47340-like n=1 Tax=Salvia hispanica TaxID=49212 RepID=UPI0020092F47|nr:F-box protein At1g47340-like [Salvia hispanica]
MGRNFFQILPSELTSNILSRLPFRSVAISKCVCKSWLNLLNSDYFEIKFPPTLVTLKWKPSRCKIFEIEDKGEADLESHDLHYAPLTDFKTPLGITPMECTAANGLLLLHPQYYTDNRVYICNPLTCEYIRLVCPINYALLEDPLPFDFCVSKISGKYKVVYVARNNESDYFQVYTLGKWRRVQAPVPDLKFYSYGHAECNGNLHWVGDDLVQPSFLICVFDVETECFSFFSPPPDLPGDEELLVFKDCLCICYPQDYEIVI